MNFIPNKLTKLIIKPVHTYLHLNFGKRKLISDWNVRIKAQKASSRLSMFRDFTYMICGCNEIIFVTKAPF